jgi:hypothetical protein
MGRAGGACLGALAVIVVSICIAVTAVCAVVDRWQHFRFLRHFFDETRDKSVLDHLPPSRVPVVFVQLPQRKEHTSP